jgi:triosephosphate isomerase
MRTPIIAGNWKMHKTIAEGRQLVEAIGPEVSGVAAVETVVCPSFVALSALAPIVQRYRIGLGAQDLYWEPAGAFTGEVSAAMLAELCRYVIIGHSERRQYFGETDDWVNRKVKAALGAGLCPIMCVGENLDQYDAGETETVVGRQMRAGLAGRTAAELAGAEGEPPRLVIAYEPVWAIGTGKAATGAGANRVIGLTIRGALSELFGEDLARRVRVQYGGSVSPGNIAEFMSQPDVDGALVGGSSLKADQFAAIVAGTAKAKG